MDKIFTDLISNYEEKGQFQYDKNKFPKKISASTYLYVMCKIMQDSISEGNNIQAQYAAINMLSVIESEASNYDINPIIMDEIDIKKEDYECMMTQIKAHHKRFKQYKQKNIAISIVTQAFLFYMIHFIFKLNIWITAIIICLFLVVDLFMTYKSNLVRFQRKEMSIYIKNVDQYIISFCKNYTFGNTVLNTNRNVTSC